LTKHPVIAVACARAWSSRLPGKVLHEVDGVSLLVRILHRVERILPGGVRIVVSTTTLPVDDQVAGLATAEGYAVSRGHPTNVSEQFAKAVEQYGRGCRYVLRVMTDQPFLDWEAAAESVAILDERGWDLVLPLTFAEEPVYGAGVSAWSRHAWDTCYARAGDDPRYAEHPGLWFRANLPTLNFGLRELPHWCYRPYRLEVDEWTDLDMVKAVHAVLGNEPPLGKVVRWLDSNPQVVGVNAAVEERTSPTRSLGRDTVAGWRRDYAGREVVWSGVADLVGYLHGGSGDRRTRPYRCPRCRGVLVATEVLHRRAGGGDLRLVCAGCKTERIFYAERPGRV